MQCAIIQVCACVSTRGHFPNNAHPEMATEQAPAELEDPFEGMRTVGLGSIGTYRRMHSSWCENGE